MENKKIVVWGLFDSGGGSYYKAAKEMENIELFSVGIDRENKSSHFINLDLADYSQIFTKHNKIFEALDKLPHPDLIIASPPCESWSNASAMANGNACWKREVVEDSFLPPQTPLSRFTVREYKDYEGYQYKPDSQILTRINGELTIYNTIQIIKKYKPKVFIIENPAHGRIWDYIKKILGFNLKHENLTYYNNYDYPIRKPTRFSSNIYLGLDVSNNESEFGFKEMNWSYNERSNIPIKLVKEIFTKAENYIKNNTIYEVKEIAKVEE